MDLGKLPLIGKRLLNGKTMFSLKVDEQIQLRLIDESELDVHYALLDANREHIGVWESWVQSATYHGQIDYIRFMREQYETGQGFTCGIWWRPDVKASYRLTGNVSYRVNDENSSVEVGYWLGTAYTGKGIVTRTVRALVDYAVNKDNMKRVVIQTAAENTASRAVAERAGFTLDGIIRREMNIYGQLVDRAVYTILAEEWQAL